MTFGRTLFSQIMDFVPWTSFDRIVSRYGGDIRVRSLRCSEQFRIMTFAQMTYRESLRDMKHVLAHNHRSCMAWDCVSPLQGRLWPMQTNGETGAYGRTLPLS